MRFTSRIYIDSSCSSDASSRGTRMGRAAHTSPSLRLCRAPRGARGVSAHTHHTKLSKVTENNFELVKIKWLHHTRQARPAPSFGDPQKRRRGRVLGHRPNG
jgi:hypothetical protein